MSSPNLDFTEEVDTLVEREIYYYAGVSVNQNELSWVILNDLER